MKNYLLTWYGITDLRASLGLEDTKGPILAALCSGEYTDVCVLAYTNGEKPDPDNWDDRIAGASVLDNAGRRDFVDQFANTRSAHRHFCQWLKEKLDASGIQTEIHVCEVPLRHLNDTEMIYEAANKAMERVASDVDSRATLYLSPGTPVMAFVWAFASLRHPCLPTRFIAAPQPKLPPQEIRLPEEWMMWHGRQVRHADESSPYDVIFHLFGEQRIPALLGITQFNAKRHVFINSERYPADAMKQFTGTAAWVQLPVDPYSPAQTRDAILQFVKKLPENSKIGFNLTGGTKLMFAGAMSACRMLNATSFYFNTGTNRTILLDDYRSIPLKPIDSVETFIHLHVEDLCITVPGHAKDIKNFDSQERKRLMNSLWRSRNKLSNLYIKLEKYVSDNLPFELDTKDIYVRFYKNNAVDLTLGEERFEFPMWPFFGKYLCGGWFEEYVYHLFQIADKIPTDMRINLQVGDRNIENKKKSKNTISQLNRILGQPYQEFDVTFTDGKRLYLVECKAGKVTSDHVMKLHTITRKFGGIEAIGILAACFEPDNMVKKKIQDYKNLRLVCGSKIRQQIDTLVSKLF